MCRLFVVLLPLCAQQTSQAKRYNLTPAAPQSVNSNKFIQFVEEINSFHHHQQQQQKTYTSLLFHLPPSPSPSLLFSPSQLTSTWLSLVSCRVHSRQNRVHKQKTNKYALCVYHIVLSRKLESCLVSAPACGLQLKSDSTGLLYNNFKEKNETNLVLVLALLWTCLVLQVQFIFTLLYSILLGTGLQGSPSHSSFSFTSFACNPTNSFFYILIFITIFLCGGGDGDGQTFV